MSQPQYRYFNSEADQEIDIFWREFRPSNGFDVFVSALNHGNTFDCATGYHDSKWMSCVFIQDCKQKYPDNWKEHVGRFTGWYGTPFILGHVPEYCKSKDSSMPFDIIRFEKAVTIIQNAWRKACNDPRFRVCRKRLLRGFEELCAGGFFQNNKFALLQE